MRKKVFLKIMILVFVFTFFVVQVKAESEIMGETLVYRYVYVSDLPTQFVKGSDIATYEYAGEEVYDFRYYFEVYDNAETILNMYDPDEPVDLGGYFWETDFDIDVVGTYDVNLSYDGVTGYKTNFITLEVIEADEEAPSIFMVDRVFNKTRAERPQDFDREFEIFLESIRVYDKVDGIINIKRDNFPEAKIEELRNADLGAKIQITLDIADKAGNESTRTIQLSVVDSKAPNIQNVKTISTKKGKRINFTKHLIFSDNYTDSENIERDYEIYSTLVQLNIWTVAARRKNQSAGRELNDFLRLDGGLESYLSYLEREYKSSYLVDDYFEIIDENDETIYFYIKAKETVVEEGEEVIVNVWTQTSNKSEITGKILNRHKVSSLSKAELFDYVETEYETGYSENDYFEVLDLKENEKYFIYIDEKEELLTDKIDTINFNKIGVSYVRVTARDEFGNTSVATYRVVVENGIGLMTTVLIVNGVVLALSGISIGVYILLRKRK